MSARHDVDPKAMIAARRREATKPGREKKSGRGSGLTPRIKKAMELMVFGRPGDPRSNVSVDDAAAEVGLRPRAVREAMLKPAIMAYHQELVVAMRRGERATSFRVMAAIRDDATLRPTASGQKVQLEAAKALAYEPANHAIQVNTQVNVNGQAVTPGYVIDLTRDKYREEIEDGGAVGEDMILIDDVEDARAV
ncbi:hypothetical protein [Sinorhizobium meliloti]|uniref:hypothetical protein n=1 Tax=Rhizobium meliloti TaxID=382 RepID=UPI000FD8071E|nr:hypothetical protein [Sinorhizobium meliloti]RVL05655.1 hypothetical protein CN152_03375 [Sinorhizobium meliloti]RVN49959.1 hypothetical protein CN113_06960 [Sinorhizobium meliloti]